MSGNDKKNAISKPQTKLFTGDLGVPVHTALKLAAVERGVSMSDLVVQGLAAIGIEPKKKEDRND